MPDLMKSTLFAGTAAVLAFTGCSQPRYYAAAPPPPPAYGPSPLLGMAESNGFQDGQRDGARDLYQRRQYRPTWDRRYAQTPGYDSRFGPYPVYRDHYRAAYLRGYDTGFRRAEQSQ